MISKNHAAISACDCNYLTSWDSSPHLTCTVLVHSLSFFLAIGSLPSAPPFRIPPSPITPSLNPPSKQVLARFHFCQ